jgi:hypothetical protein
MDLRKEEHTIIESSVPSNPDEVIEVTAKNEDDWVSNKWRPAMAWLYLVTCAFDFIIAPIASAIIYAQYGQEIRPWVPITLQGAGLYHLAMGAIVGITSWSRGQERMSELRTLSQMSRTVESDTSPVTRVETTGYRVRRRVLPPDESDMLDADQEPRTHNPENRTIG